MRTVSCQKSIIPFSDYPKVADTKSHRHSLLVAFTFTTVTSSSGAHHQRWLTEIIGKEKHLEMSLLEQIMEI
jgi:hypothetical protein